MITATAYAERDKHIIGVAATVEGGAFILTDIKGTCDMGKSFGVVNAVHNVVDTGCYWSISPDSYVTSQGQFLAKRDFK